MIIHFNDTELEVVVSDDSYRRRAVQDKSKLILYYSLTHHIEIPVGAWVEYEGEVFTLEKASDFTKNSSRDFSYILTLGCEWSRSEKYKVKNPVDGRLKFSYTAKPHEFIQLIVDNMNMRESGWTVGECIDAVEQFVSFNHVYCSDALTIIADAFETEWEVIGKTINLRKVEYFKDNPLPLSYGKGNGFKTEISRTNQDGSRAVEILYVQGGTENINPSKYGSRELLLPKSQELEYEGHVYISSSDGLYMTRKGKEPSSKVEDSLDCSSISPKRVGEVSTVVAVDEAKHFYDFIDTTIPSDLNFTEYLMDGETMTIIFQSGMLAGKEFEVKYYHDAKGGKASRRFEIVPQEIDGQTMPNETFKPVVGDKYAVFHISLPDAYVCNNADKSGASWDMYREAARYFYEHEGELFTFKGALDGIWAKKDWLNIGGRIKPGAYVLFSDEQFHPEGSLVRMTEVKDFVNNPHSPVIELSNAPVSSSLQNTMHKVTENEVIVEDKHRAALQFTKRRFRDSQETIGMLRDAMLENFTESVSPLAVETMMMLVGDRSLQFTFVESRVNPVEIAYAVTFDQASGVLSAPGATVMHMTLGIDTLSSGHALGSRNTWYIPSFNSPPLDAEKRLYLYAKVSRNVPQGVFYLSESAIGFEEVANYYHLLVGILNREYEGARSFVPLYGFTEILPGQIRTNRIATVDGKSFFDLAANALHVGNSTSHLEWNHTVPNALRLTNATIHMVNADGRTMIHFNGEDGSGELAAGNISFDVDGNVSYRGNVTAQSGRIGQFDIGSYGALTSTGTACYNESTCRMSYEHLSLAANASNETNNRGVMFMVAGGSSGTGMGYCGGTPINARIDLHQSRSEVSGAPLKQKIGLLVSVDGSYSDSALGDDPAGNHAIFVERGGFVGFRPLSRVVTDNAALFDYDSVVIADTSVANVTLTLPENPQPDQRYTIRKLKAANYLQVNAKSGIYWKNSDIASLYLRSNARLTYEMQYIAPLKAWVAWESSVS